MFGPLNDPQPVDRACKSAPGAGLVKVAALFGEKADGPLLRRQSALPVDFVRPLGRFGEHHDMVLLDVDEPPARRKASYVSLGIGEFHLPDPDLGEERGVIIENLKSAGGSGGGKAYHVAAEEQLRRRDNLQFERLHLHPLLARAAGRAYDASFLWRSTTSSIVPAMKKWFSGIWSYSPSTIPLNPLIVSSSFTYLPWRPVNCSETKNGCERNF